MNHEEYKTMSKSATVTSINSLVASTNELPAHLKAVEGAGRGNEHVGANVQIPRVKLLQKMSNEVDKHHGNYVEGCEPGHMVNTLTNHNYGNDLYCMSLQFKTEFVVWRHLEAGGGYGGAFVSHADAQPSMTLTKLTHMFFSSRTLRPASLNALLQSWTSQALSYACLKLGTLRSA